jgi:hypothetical protein
VEEEAIKRAEAECLADGEVRARRREREAERRAELDREYVERFALRGRELFPACPTGGERAIAEHACRKYSGRIGRLAAGKTLDEEAIRLAVTAHVRHTETRYDELLAKDYERREARERVEEEVLRVLAKWEGDSNSGA